MVRMVDHGSIIYLFGAIYPNILKYIHYMDLGISEQGQKSLEGPARTVNKSLQSENLVDYSRSPRSSTYQTSADGMEYTLVHERDEQWTQRREQSRIREDIGDKSNGKEEVVWIDYHPPPKDDNRTNV